MQADIYVRQRVVSSERLLPALIPSVVQQQDNVLQLQIETVRCETEVLKLQLASRESFSADSSASLNSSYVCAIR